MIEEEDCQAQNKLTIILQVIRIQRVGLFCL